METTGTNSWCQGCLMLYRLDLGSNEDIADALEALEKASYVLKNLDHSSRAIVHDALVESTTLEVEEVAEGIGRDYEEARDSLYAMENALDFALEEERNRLL